MYKFHPAASGNVSCVSFCHANTHNMHGGTMVREKHTSPCRCSAPSWSIDKNFTTRAPACGHCNLGAKWKEAAYCKREHSRCIVTAAQSMRQIVYPHARISYAAARHPLGDALRLTVVYFIMQSHPVSGLRCCASANLKLVALFIQHTRAVHPVSGCTCYERSLSAPRRL